MMLRLMDPAADEYFCDICEVEENIYELWLGTEFEETPVQMCSHCLDIMRRLLNRPSGNQESLTA